MTIHYDGKGLFSVNMYDLPNHKTVTGFMNPVPEDVYLAFSIFSSV